MMLSDVSQAPIVSYPWKDFSNSSHAVLQGWLQEFAPKTRVFDLGMGCGFVGDSGNSLGLVVDGCDQEIPEVPSSYHKVWSCDLNGPWLFMDQQYPVIVAADILEHLLKPEEALQRIKSLLTPEGVLMVSLPNVAHLTVRGLLLWGQFPRMDRGILDKTHLHFYTLKTAQALLEAAGFQIQRLQAVPAPIQLALPWTAHGLFAPLHQLHSLLVKAFPTLFGYQFLFWAVPREACHG